MTYVSSCVDFNHSLRFPKYILFVLYVPQVKKIKSIWSSNTGKKITTNHLQVFFFFFFKFSSPGNLFFFSITVTKTKICSWRFFFSSILFFHSLIWGNMVIILTSPLKVFLKISNEQFLGQKFSHFTTHEKHQSSLTHPQGFWSRAWDFASPNS